MANKGRIQLIRALVAQMLLRLNELDRLLDIQAETVDLNESTDERLVATRALRKKRNDDLRAQLLDMRQQYAQAARKVLEVVSDSIAGA